MKTKIELLSEIGDKHLERRLLERVRKASQKTGIKCRALIMFKFETWKNAHEKGEYMVIQGRKIPTTVSVAGLPSTLCTTKGLIFFCKDIPEARYSEPSEEKMTHELLHEDYDKRSLKTYGDKLVQDMERKDKRITAWLRIALEEFINMNIDGYVTNLYGPNYEDEISSYCKNWIKMMEDAKTVKLRKENNLARILCLFEGCEFYARSPSHEKEILDILEGLGQNSGEFENVLLIAELYRNAYEKGKKGEKAEIEDLRKFHQAIVAR